MGHGIAQVSAMSGYNIVLRDVEQQFLDKAMEKIRWSLEKLVSKEKITKQESESILSRIITKVDLKDAVSSADLVIEAVPEIMDLKKKVYAELDSVADKRVIFASNTSTLPITEIANTTSRPEKFIGIHFFNPPQLMKLVEVIPGQKTNQEIAIVLEKIKGIKKQSVAISVTSKEQQAGMQQIKLAITQIDEATQQNATSSEELSASATETASQATELQRLCDDLNSVIKT